MNRFQNHLDKLATEAVLRRLPDEQTSNLLDLTSNDYMGLSNLETEIWNSFINRYKYVSFSSSASRLLSGKQNIHLELESILENLFCKPVLLFNSGYHANTGIIGALNLPGTLFIADKLVHASIIDGLIAGRCNFIRFPHNDLDVLGNILKKQSGKYDSIVIVIESIYSMDGDIAPLQEITALKREFPEVMIYLDEAHAFGVRGKRGLGLAEELGLIEDIDILIGTLGKAAFSSGAFVACCREIKDFLINTARSLIFSTAIAPANVAWSILTVERLINMETDRIYLKQLSLDFRSLLNDKGFSVPLDDTPIVPLCTGNAEKAVRLSEYLKENGILALPIRRPTVPPGGERIRFSLNAALSCTEISRIMSVLENCASDFNRRQG